MLLYQSEPFGTDWALSLLELVCCLSLCVCVFVLEKVRYFN